MNTRKIVVLCAEEWNYQMFLNRLMGKPNIEAELLGPEVRAELHSQPEPKDLPEEGGE